MNAAVATAFALVAYAVGYQFYSRYLSDQVFELREDVETPAHKWRDGVDYVPTHKYILFGHHYASIAGLAPMLGPAVAVIWGWLPAMAWVVIGALFVGCVHDFGSLVVSVRAKGLSIGAVAERVIGKRAKTLLHLIIFFLVALAMGVFVYVIAFLFSAPPSPEKAQYHFPQAVLPSIGLMLIAMLIGWLGYKRNVSWTVMTPIGFVAFMALIYVAQLEPVVAATGLADPAFAPSLDTWSTILLVYAFIASVLPVWTLLQPRDFLNGLLLFVGLGSLYLGLFIMQPEFSAPAVRPSPEGAPGLFPFVFIVIACGAASGFHSLVSSGTTAKQLDNETDARLIGYGGMIGESLLGLIAVLATTAGIMTADAWQTHYASWEKVQALGQKVSLFINGSATFLTGLSVPEALGASFVSVVVVSYALTSLDSATRLLRYNVEEITQTIGHALGEPSSRETGPARESSTSTITRVGQNRFVSGAVAAAAIGFFAFYEVDGKPAGLVLWQLFGTTNQIMAALALLVVTLYLFVRQKPWYVAGVPMLGMFATTLSAMVQNLISFWSESQWLLFGVGSVLFLLACWLIVEAAILLYRFSGDKKIVETLDIEA